MDFGESLGLALALFFLMEGLLPLVAPARWRRMFLQIMELHDGQLRFLGLLSILLGLAIFLLL